jgi:heme/copper-type cytochrome/quinol oxidase subunit 4
MHSLRVLIILSWIALPTVMFGGYSLLRLLLQGGVLTPAREQFFRAGHGHAGSLLLMSLLYDYFMDATSLSSTVKVISAIVLFLSILAISFGFFLHMPRADMKRPSAGTTLTAIGSIFASLAILVLVYGLITV